MIGTKPADELEGMLAAQMVATHNAAMECYRRASIEGQTFEGRDNSLKHAAKLTRAYAELLAAPKGSRNALKHGRTTAAALAARRAIMRLIRVSRRTLEEMGG